jgi:hypothetical protein
VAVLSNASIDAVVDLGAHVLNPRRDLMSYPKEVAIDPICLARLVGRYQMNDWVFEVTSTGDRLHVPIGDQHRVFPTLGMAFLSQERARATHLRTRRGWPRRPPGPALQRH